MERENMSGTKAGASKAVATMLKKHGKDYYARIGAKGGKAKVPKGFASNRERARLAGIKGCEARLRNLGVIK